MQVYLDNASTTKMDPRVIEAMRSFQELNIGDASSLHKLGIEAARAVESSREIIAKRINADPREILFSSGGQNLIIWLLKGSHLQVIKEKGRDIITTVKADNK